MIVARWHPTYEPAGSSGNSEQIQQLLAEMRAKLKPSQQGWGPAMREADLTDDRQDQGNWIDSSHGYAHLIPQKPHLRQLIKLDLMIRVDPDKDVQPIGHLKFDRLEVQILKTCNASETTSAICNPKGVLSRSMSIDRACWNTTSPVVGHFPQAMAKPIARYKDESKPGTHTAAYKYCYTAPPPSPGE